MSDPEREPGADEGAGEPAAAAPLVVVGTSDGVESLEAELERPVVTLDPARLDAESLERVTEASAVIVPWDLGSQAGLDLVEALRQDERTRNVPIIMASAKPTRAAVAMALRAGASGFIFQPYESDDIRRHLKPAEEGASEGEADAESEPTPEPDAESQEPAP